MPNPYKRCFALCLCFFAAGLLIGYAIDAKFRPNHIQLWVDDVQEVGMASHEGDVIEWKALDYPDDHMKIAFHGGSPCAPPTGPKADPTDSNPCTVAKIPDGSTYFYSCQATKHPSYICSDPTYGPKGGSGGPLEGLDAFVVDAFRGFRDELPRNSIAIPSEPAKPAVTGSIVRANIGCDSNNAPSVTTINDTSVVYASQNAVVKWTSSTGGSTSVTMTAPSPCVEAGTPQQPNNICTILPAAAKTTYTYSITNSSCTATQTTTGLQLIVQ